MATGFCDVTESFATCPADCTQPATCGDGTCSVGEDATTCPDDCSPATCGDGTCSAGEDATTCPDDCDPGVCGDVCAIGPPLSLDDCNDAFSYACIDDVCGNLLFEYCCTEAWDDACVAEASAGFCCEQE